MILSGYQVMVKTFAAQRPTLSNIWNDVFPDDGPVAKSLIEISGAAGSGTSVLLYELMARASLSIVYGGKSSKIIFLDLTLKFDFDIFEKIIQKCLHDNVLLCSQRPVENSICCEALIHLPCYSADEFEFAFEYFEDLLWDNRKVGLIAIDGLDTFYWDECYHQLQSMSTHYKKLIQRLKPLCQEHNICCAYTVDASYLTLKSKSWQYFPHSLIDYKLKLINHTDGRFYINDSLIKLNYDGVTFLNG